MRSVAILLAVGVAIAASQAILKHSDAAFASMNKLSQSEVQNNVWAVLIAGSSGWGNYRHQADICHAYQTLRARGVPEDHIITFMFDDIANNRQNPYKGTIINEPNGPNVYAGVKIDYKGADITVQTFTNALTGASNAGHGTGRVLTSGPSDNVYVFFDDHGNTDIIGFPDENVMTSAQLSKTIDTMAQKKLFGRLVMYISACLSGSMFYKLSLPENVYVTTSAPVGASAYALFYDNARGTYLCSGYPYGINTFMDSSKDGTFNEQFNFAVSHLQNYSQPCQYGDLAWATETSISDFFNMSSDMKAVSEKKAVAVRASDVVADWDVPFETAHKAHMMSNSKDSYGQYKREQVIRSAVDTLAAKVSAAAIATDKLLPCTTCDSTCNCIKECDSYDPEMCKFQCCDQRGCTQDYKKTAMEQRAEKAHRCTMTLTKALQRQCGLKHHYLAKAEAHLHFVCRQEHINVRAALAEINNQCNIVSALF